MPIRPVALRGRWMADRTVVPKAIGAAALVVASCATAQSASRGVTTTDLADLGRRTVDEIWRLCELLLSGLHQQPAARLAVSVALAVPILAAAGALGRLPARLRARRELARVQVQEPLTAGRSAGPHSAWIEVEASSMPPVRLGELIRLGHAEDCDVALPGASITGTHAVIQRTEDREFHIFDVSAGEGPGVAVNGERLAHGRLRNGDLIEIGASRVVFREGRDGAHAGGTGCLV
jgi:hypothetical protein